MPKCWEPSRALYQVTAATNTLCKQKKKNKTQICNKPFEHLFTSHGIKWILNAYMLIKSYDFLLLCLIIYFELK